MARYQTGLSSALPCALVALVLLSTLVSCGPADVNTLRQNYTAELNGWFKSETPIAEPVDSGENGEMADAAGEEGMEDEAAEDEGMGDEGTGDEVVGEDEEADDMAPPMDVQQTVTLDILLKHEGGGELPGITLDISQAGSDGTEKQSWKLWVDTSNLAGVKQLTETLEDVTLEDGDGFNVEVRQFVPPEEQGEYQEFSSAPPA